MDRDRWFPFQYFCHSYIIEFVTKRLETFRLKPEGRRFKSYLIQTKGEEAALEHIWERMGALEAERDTKGIEAWTAILQAFYKLIRKAPVAGEGVH